MAKTKVTGEYLKDSVVRFTAKAGENITKGNAVYISGISGELPVVSLADADDANKMPCFGLAEATVSTNAEVDVISYGSLKGLNTSSFSLGDILFIGTTAGALTNDPAGLEATKLQNIGIVQRVHASNGSIKVGGAGRTNAVPNLDNGDIFIGNSDNKAVSSALSTEIESYLDGGTSTPTFASATVTGDFTVDTSTLKVDSTNNRVGIATDNPAYPLQVRRAGGAGSLGISVDNVGTTDRVAQYFAIQDDATGNGSGHAFYSRAPSSTTDTLTLMIDENQRVGIGTSSPQGTLHVKNTSDSATLTSVSDSIVLSHQSGSYTDGNYYGVLGFSKANSNGGTLGAAIAPVMDGTGAGTDLTFSTALAAGSCFEKMRITDSGYVGIATINPQVELDVKGNIDLSASSTETRRIEIGTGRSGNGYAFLDLIGDATYSDYGTRLIRQNTGANANTNFIHRGTGNFVMETDEAAPIVLATDSTERMRIDSSGNVGIGIDSPSDPLHIEKSTTVALKLARTGVSDLRIISSTAAVGNVIDAEDNKLTLRTSTAEAMIFETNNSERMRIDSSHGDLTLITSYSGGTYPFRVGYGSYASFTPTFLIDDDGSVVVNATSQRAGLAEAHYFVGSSSNSGSAPFTVYNDSGTANCPALNVMNRDESVDSSNRFIQFWANVTSNTAQAMGGIVGNSATNAQFATLSDEREKENITPVTGILDKVMNLNVVSFDWKFNDEHVKAGFIAQNVEEHFPEYVIENVSLEGEEPRKGTTGGMSAGYIAVLTKAIQEQQEQIESLKNEIELLKGN